MSLPSKTSASSVLAFVMHHWNLPIAGHSCYDARHEQVFLIQVAARLYDAILSVGIVFSRTLTRVSPTPSSEFGVRGPLLQQLFTFDLLGLISA